MGTFNITLEDLRKGWSSTPQYWFSTKDYKIKNIVDFAELDQIEDISQSSYLVTLGYIPYFMVTNEEVIRSFVDSLENKKLKSAMAKIDSENYIDSFWKYVNLYPEMEELLCTFENSYVLDKAEKWCKENGIKYTIEL